MDKVSQWDCCIYLASPLVDIFEQIYMETGLDFYEFCLVVEDGIAEEWIDQDRFKECTEEILEREKRRPGYLMRLISTFERKKLLFMELVDEIERSDIGRMDKEALMGYLGTFLRLYRDQYVLPILTFFYKEHLSEMLLERLSPRFGENTAEVLSYVTTSEQESFSYAERRSMLNIMSGISDALGGGLFQREPEEIVALLREAAPEQYGGLVEHSSMYFWINNNYRRVFILGPTDFIIKMKDESLSFTHPRDELELMEGTRKDALAKKAVYLAQLNDEERTMAYILSEGAWWQDERKRCNLIGNHILMMFLREISRQTSVPEEILRNAAVDEMGRILYGTANLEDIRDRGKEALSIYCRVKGAYAEMAMLPGRRYSESAIDDMDEFHGTPASPGSAEGEVVVITKEEDFGKMRQGAILVSVMTRPEYVPIMKKAAGMITDEGGLTCHAAVVSREFGIPAVVGTKIATRLLRDGDRVRLGNGYVKIISRR